MDKLKSNQYLEDSSFLSEEEESKHGNLTEARVMRNPGAYDLPRVDQSPRQVIRESLARARSQVSSDPDFEKLSNIYETILKTPSRNSAKREASRNQTSTSIDLGYKRTKEQLLKEREDKFKAECTFKPRINAYTNSSVDRSVPHAQRLQNLAKPKTEAIERRQREKREKEDKETVSYPFKPAVNSYFPNSFDSSKSTFSAPIEDRLYFDARQKHLDREKFRRELLEAEASLHPYKPQVQSSLKKLVGSQKEKPPIYQRVSEIQKERHDNLQKIRKEAIENDSNATFKPNINVQSQKLAAAKRVKEDTEGLTIAEKLSREASVRLERHSQLIEQHSVQYSFSPQVSVQSDLGNSFLERQKIMQERLEAKRKELASKTDQFDFKPNIDKTSKYIATAGRNNENFEDKIQRMSKEETQKRQEKQERIQEEHYSQFSFEPKINSLSKQLGRTASLQELAINEEVINKRREKAKEQMEKLEKSCTFTPTIFTNHRYSYVNSGYSQQSNILNGIEKEMSEKMEKRERLKQKQEFEDMQSCTFRPEVTENKSNPATNVNVAGIDRFLELKDIAKRLELEKKMREEKAFHINSNFEPPFPHTVPHPFDIQPSQREEKIQKIRDRLMEKEKQECTFKPHISELRKNNYFPQHMPKIEEGYLFKHK